jgi:hypothetical protein
VLLSARLEKLGRELSVRGEQSADAGRSRDGRRASGAYFTPAPLVEFVVAETLGARLARPVRWHRDGSPALIVLDPAAGDGRFLAAAADLLADRAAARGADPVAARRAIVARCLIGVERDAEFVKLARARLGDSAVVHQREALLDSPVAAGAVDVVVGNPPYQRSIHFSRTDEELWRALRGRYAATSHGEWDLYAAFLEQSLAWTRPGGQVRQAPPPPQQRPAAPPRQNEAARINAARNRAAGLYRNRRFDEAAETLRGAAGLASGSEADALRALATNYETVGVNMTRAAATETSSPTDSLAAYRRAFTLDSRAGGSAHAAFLRAKLGAVAPRAAASFMAQGRYELAKAAADVAQSNGAGNDATVVRVRRSLEGKAEEIFNNARRVHKSNPKQSQQLLRRILRIVPAESPWYVRAYRALNARKSGPQDEDE